MTVDMLAYGEAMGALDSERSGPLRLGGPMRLSMAGAESTVAIGVARLGRTAGWVGVVGNDEVGRLVTRVLRAEAVAIDGVGVVDHVPTGLMLKERRCAGVSRVVYYRRALAGACLSPVHVRAEDVAEAQFLHLSGVTPALSASARAAVFKALELAREARTQVCVDVNYRSGLWATDEARPVLADMVARAAVVLATADEVRLLEGEPVDDPAAAVARLASRGPSLAVVKLGPHGAVAWNRSAIRHVQPVPVEMVESELSLLRGADVLR